SPQPRHRGQRARGRVRDRPGRSPRPEADAPLQRAATIFWSVSRTVTGLRSGYQLLTRLVSDAFPVSCAQAYWPKTYSSGEVAVFFFSAIQRARSAVEPRRRSSSFLPLRRSYSAATPRVVTTSPA